MEVKLHDIGEGMTQADILTFLVKPGDVVKADDPLVEVQTDKMTAEIPAPADGIIKELIVQTGETVTVGTTLITMTPSNNKYKAAVTPTPNEASISIEKKQETFMNKVSTANYKRVMAAPYTRKIARENNINIEEVTGTGPAGRITDQDVFNFVQQKEEGNNHSSSTTTGVQHKQDTSNSIKTLPYNGRRKQIGKRMAQSIYSIPHCTHYEEIDVTNLLNIRDEWKELNKNISATAYFIKGVSIALKDFPIFNATLNEKDDLIYLHSSHHIGIATDTKSGLVVPVIRNVEEKSLIAIHKELKELTVKAQEDKLSIKEMTGSTFTISNVGPLGGSIGATPIINPPEVGLIAFHKTKKRPIVDKNDQIVIRSMMNVSMSFDHRVADGATAVSFTNRLTQLIENPNSFMLELV